jgi:MinD-like ATPase involved in chromosome partitioning or flagellar assembly
MPTIISVHSFRGGTGKSNFTANIATALAMNGKRVGIIDTDIQSPGIHILFGLEDAAKLDYALNDYLWGNCSIEQATYNVTANAGASVSGQVFLIPSSIKPGEIARVLKDGYEVRRLHQGIRDIIQKLNLDVLMIDTHPGLNEETLLSFALSNVLVIVMRPDKQDYQGTGVTMSVARRLKINRLMLILNKVPAALDFAQLKQDAEHTYDCEVAAVLPHSDEMMMLASEGIFVTRYPDHDFSARLHAVAKLLV